MRKRLMTGLLAIASAIAIAAAFHPVAVEAQDDEVKQQKKIIIQKMTEGDDLHEIHEGDHSIVFIDEDGVSTRLHGEGEGFRWFAGPHGKEMTFAFAGFGSGAFLGVGTTELTPELRSHFGVAEDSGVMVSKVLDDSGAFTAGVLVGDIITVVDGEAISSGHDLRKAIRSREEGDSVTLEVWRDGKAQQINAILGESEGPLGSSFTGLPHLEGGHFARMMKIDCDDANDDCAISLSGEIEACEGVDECEVKVSCDEGECECTVNGELTDCEEIDGIHLRHDD